MLVNGRGITKIVESPRQLVEFRKVFVGGKNALRIFISKYFHAQNQLGQDLAEFAVVLPLLLLIVLGVLDLGRAFHANITIANASRAGARYATSFGFEHSGGSVVFDVADITVRTQQEALNSGVTLDSVAVNCVGACVSGGAVEVTVTHNFQFLFNAFIGSGINMTQSTEMYIP